MKVSVTMCERHGEPCPKCLEELTRPGGFIPPQPKKKRGPYLPRRPMGGFNLHDSAAKLVALLQGNPKATRTEVQRQLGLTPYQFSVTVRFARRRKFLAGKRGLVLAAQG